MAHDPKYHHDANEFKPERFDAPYNEQQPWDLMFGSGRRVCPGRTFGDASVWMAIAQILSVFNIQKSVGQDGHEIEPEKRTEGGLFNSLAPFPVTMIPRSEKAKDLVMKLEAGYEQKKEDDSKFLNRQKMPVELREALIGIQNQ